jgi:hypothetical protein
MSAITSRDHDGDAFHAAIQVRAYCEEVIVQKPEKKGGRRRPKPTPRKERERAGPSAWTLVFDTETTTDASQQFKLGFYRLYEEVRLEEERLFIDADALSAAELETVSAYIHARGLDAPMSLAAFRSEVLIKRGFALGATIVTFNGPFDFARVAIDWKPARAGEWRRKMQGGFSLSLSDSAYDPAIQIKHLNPRASLVELSAPRRQESSRSVRKRRDQTPTHRGFFVDVKTLAGALMSRSHSLESLAVALATPTQKVRSEEHGQAVTFDYLDYARSDVAATWECYQALGAKYRTFGFTTPIHEIISEAGIGKAALQTMGIKSWMEVQPGGIDRGLTSLIMSTYYGGRTEVRIRRKRVRVVHTDFTSMYPTVCTLQHLWAFVIGRGFKHRDATAEVRALVAEATPAMFQDAANWLRLAVLVRVRSDRDFFPVRAPYSEPSSVLKRNGTARPASATIALNGLSHDQPMWFTLADCLAAKFLSGKIPYIEEAILFEPGQPQPNLAPISMLGRHPIDPYRDDFYRELIRARQFEEAHKAGKPKIEEEKIEEIREALKTTANSSSYGIFVQVNVNAAPRKALMRVFRPDGSFFTKRMAKVETPGPWFNPLLATLITGAARLMLALAEARALETGLEWAFCDTDSLAIAQPDRMEDATFLRLADGVVEWFRPLNPYGFDASILKKEKVNFDPDGGGEPVALYCWAISSKRYALFNVAADGSPRIRKASAHGLGHLLSPYDDDDAPACFPAPLKSVLGGKEKLQRWHYDVWYAILSAVVAGRPNKVRFDYHPALAKPTVSRYAATSPEIIRWFEHWRAGEPYANRVKPFGFLLLFHLSKFARHPDVADDSLEGAAEAGETFPVAPFDRDLQKAVASAFDRVTGKPVDPALLETYAEVLAGYPYRAEAKFENGRARDRGTTKRRCVVATTVEFIGKEADRWEEENYIGMGGEIASSYGVDPKIAEMAFRRVRVAVGKFGKLAVSEATGIARSTLAKIESGKWTTTRVPYHQALRGLDRLRSGRARQAADRQRTRAQLAAAVTREGGIRPAARMLGLDPSNLSKFLREVPCKARRET